MITNDELILYVTRMDEFTRSQGFFKTLLLKWRWWKKHEAWCPRCEAMSGWSVANKKQFTRLQCEKCGLGVVLQAGQIYDIFIHDV
jgi:hypothetical protein